MTSGTMKETIHDGYGALVNYLNAADELHREDGPARIRYYADGGIEYEEFWMDGELHREDGPAWLRYYGDGQVYREGYFLYGKQHRVDGPARTAYYADGRVKYEGFYVDGNCHKENGPAWIEYDQNGQIELEEFWIDNEELTAKEFLYKTYIDKLVDPVSRDQATQLAEAAGWKITAEQLNTAVWLTLKDAAIIKLGSAATANNRVCREPGV